ASLPPVARAAPAFAPWPGFGRDATHSGTVATVGPQRGVVLWRRQLEGPVVAGAAVGRGGVAYVASNAGVLHAVDVRTGRDRWTFDGRGGYGVDLSTVAAVLPDGTVLWPGPRQRLFALDSRGRLRWSIALDGEPTSPLVDLRRRRLYLADMSGAVRAFDLGRADGPPVLRWKVSLGGTSYGSPALDPRSGTVYQTSGSSLFAVSGGRVRWSVRARDIVEVSPAVAPDGTVLFGANDSTEYGVTPEGRVRWRFPIGAITYSSTVVTPGGIALFGDHKRVLHALDARTGRERGRFGGASQLWTAAAVDRHNDVYFADRRGHVYGYAATGRRLFDHAGAGPYDAYPALAADGTLLIGSENGELLALRGG
ncbi:MAG: PQQ-binding-like beta-propeller repeat protein, partial [Solirubrobacteraceae bacterium]